VLLLVPAIAAAVVAAAAALAALGVALTCDALKWVCIFPLANWRPLVRRRKLNCGSCKRGVLRSCRKELCHSKCAIFVLKVADFVPSKSKRCILKDCCEVREGTVLSPDTVVPPFAVFSGSPGL
jgi:hypothetical protein